MINLDSIADLSGLKVTVMGLGLNGGGMATTRFLAEAGAIVTATDLRSQEELAPTLEKLQDLKTRSIKINYVLGEHRMEDFTTADLVIKNPAIRKGNPYLTATKWIETDLSLFLRFTCNPIIAVTGSKGKSTTVSALYYLLERTEPKTFLGGNITVSPLSFYPEALANPTAPVVLELSSWQLADLHVVERQSNQPLLKPMISIITNIMHDHQNAYEKFDDYVCDKELIFKNQTKDDFLICKRTSWGERFAKKAKARVIFLDEEVQHFEAEVPPDLIFLESENLSGWMHLDQYMIPLLPSDIGVLGLHSRWNLLLAAAAAWLYGVECDSIAEFLPRFTGIPYRMEKVCTSEILNDAGGSTRVDWINDSAATMPDAMLASCTSFTEDIYLITGGTDKELEFDAYEQLPQSIRGIFLLAGTATEKLVSHLPERFQDSVIYNSLEAAVEGAVAQLKGDNVNCGVVLLSPGAASFGMFTNEFDRGDQFNALARVSRG